MACSFSRLKVAQRSSGVADPPIHKSSSSLVKQLPIAQGQQFLAQNREECRFRHPLRIARVNFFQDLEDVLAAEALIGQPSRKPLMVLSSTVIPMASASRANSHLLTTDSFVWHGPITLAAFSTA